MAAVIQRTGPCFLGVDGSGFVWTTQVEALNFAGLEDAQEALSALQVAIPTLFLYSPAPAEAVEV